ncbi:MAG: pseudaminic acid biosynthesis-associated methylase [Alphaproteobacteria bacterium]
MTEGPPRSEQEAFWTGAFGADYAARNDGTALLAAKTALLARILARTVGVGSVLELGASIGLNLRALRTLLPDARLAGVEINAEAHARLAALPGVQARHGSLLDVRDERCADLVLSAGVLIHLAPASLARAYDVIHRASRRYVCLIEYFNPVPVELPYRGHADRLFKRDFAGEMLDRFPGLVPVDYGFVWRRDPVFPGDDLNWFLLEKRET